MSRRRLEDERKSITHAIRVGETTVYATVGLYQDGLPGELFLRLDAAKIRTDQDNTMQGLLHVWGIAFSLALQHGCPLEDLVSKFEWMRFPPDALHATSIADALAKWLRKKFLPAPATT